MNSEPNQPNDNYNKEHSGQNEQSDNEEYGYEIYNTTTENNQRCESLTFNQRGTSVSNNPIGTESEQLDQYKLKINTQAKRLTELQLYKALCEKHIDQFSPGHRFPITENDLIEFENNSKNYQEGKGIQQILNEKEHILESLRNETLINEEQRNYIEILKQTIESSILKNNLGPSLQKAINGPTGKSNVDIVIDFTKLKNENDKIRKELIIEQVMLTDMKTDLEAYKKQSEDLGLLNIQLKESLQKETNEKKDAYKNLNQLDKSKLDLLKEYENLTKENKNLKVNLSQCQSQNKQNEIDLMDHKRELNALSTTLNDVSSYKTKYNDLTANFHELKLKYEEVNKYNKEIERSNDKLKKDLDLQISNVKKLTKLIEDNSLEHQEEKSHLIHEQNTLMNAIKHSENEHMDLSNELMQKDGELRRLKEKEKELQITQVELTEIKNTISECKASSDNKIKSLAKNLRETQIELEQLRYLNNNLQIENNTKDKDNMIARNNILQAQSEIKILKTDLEKKSHMIQDLNNQLNKEITINEAKIEENSLVLNNNTNLEREVNYWKDKYDQDLHTKSIENSDLKKEVNALTFKIEDINRTYTKIIQENSLKNDEIIKADEREKKLRNDFKLLKDNNNELNKSLEINLLNLKGELKKAYDLNNANSIQIIQIVELKSLVEKLKDENTNINQLYQSQSTEINKIKGINKENELKLYSLTTTFNSMTKIIMTTHNMIQEFISKFKEIIDENHNSSSLSSLNTFYSSAFEEFVNESKSIILNDNDYMKNIEKFVSIITTEMEMLYEHFKSINAYNNDAEKKIAMLEQSIAIGENDLKDHDLYSMKDNTMNHEYKNNNIIQYNISNDNIKEENILVDDNNNEDEDAYYQGDNYEQKMNALAREKNKYLEIIHKLRDNFPSKEIEKEVNELLSTSCVLTKSTGLKGNNTNSSNNNHNKSVNHSMYNHCLKSITKINNTNMPLNTNQHYYRPDCKQLRDSRLQIGTNASGNELNSKTYELMSEYGNAKRDNSFQSNDLQLNKFLKGIPPHDSFVNQTIYNNKNLSFSNSTIYPNNYN